MKRLGLLSLAVAFSACSGSSHVGGGGGDMSANVGDMNASVGDLATSSDGGGNEDGGAPDLAPLPPDMTLPNFGCASVNDPNAVPVPVPQSITSSRELSCTSLWEISGTTVVDNNATLTIDKGATILMNSYASLIINQGSKLVAVGTAVQPIVFTSVNLPSARLPGQWGSVVLFGKAPGNWGTQTSDMGTQVSIGQSAPDGNNWPVTLTAADGVTPIVGGGTIDNDSSGTLAYVRLEYGGLPVNSGAQFEMLGLYGVGSGTSLSHIDMRQANFGCLFAEGGSFTADHLICQWSGNGGFDFTRGNHSKVQFLVDQEVPTSSAEGLGIKQHNPPNQLAPLTNPTIYNVTVTSTAAPNNVTLKDPYCFFMNRAPSGNVYNFIGTGFSAGLLMANGVGTLAKTTLQNSILYGNVDPNNPNTNISEATGNDEDMTAWFNTAGWNNSQTNPMLQDPTNVSFLRMGPATTLTTNAATPPNDGFFDTTAAYIGAFKDRNDTWATGNWVVWAPK